MALSSGLTFNGQRVRRITRLRDSMKRIRTWNARSPYIPGKLHNLIQEMKKFSLDSTSISDIKWTSSGVCDSDNYSIYYSCSDEATYHKRYEVGIVVNAEVKKAVVGFHLLSEKVMMFSLNTKPHRLNVI